MSADSETVDRVMLSSSMPSTVEVAHLFDMHADLAPPQNIVAPGGAQMIFVCEGGVVDGPRLSGRLLPGGGEWLQVGTDRVGRIDVRATIETDDGALVYMTNRGIIKLGDEGLQRFAAGEDIAWDEAYIRSAPLFETGAPEYEWINSTMTVAINELGSGYVKYRIFEVL